MMTMVMMMLMMMMMMMMMMMSCRDVLQSRGKKSSERRRTPRADKMN
jgi:hypothetical protein